MSNPVDYIPLRTRFPSGSFDFMLIHIAKVMNRNRAYYYDTIMEAAASFEEFSLYSENMKRLFVCSLEMICDGYDAVRYEMVVNHEYHSIIHYCSKPIGELEFAQLYVLKVLMRCVRTADEETFLYIVNYLRSPEMNTVYELIQFDD